MLNESSCRKKSPDLNFTLSSLREIFEISNEAFRNTSKDVNKRDRKEGAFRPTDWRPLKSTGQQSLVAVVLLHLAPSKYLWRKQEIIISQIRNHS